MIVIYSKSMGSFMEAFFLLLLLIKLY